MINITLPDDSVREYPEGITSYEIARSISEGLARNVMAAEVNGQVWDLSRPIQENSSVKLLTWKDDAGKMTFWHSTAHLMAEALAAPYPGVKLGIGPDIENGFYYDVDFGEHPVSSDDLPRVEETTSALLSLMRTSLSVCCLNK